MSSCAFWLAGFAKPVAFSLVTYEACWVQLGSGSFT